MPPFNDIPATLRIPFVAVEFDASAANRGSGDLKYVALLIGQKTDAGQAEADTLVKLNSPADAALAGGLGSLLHRMAIGWFASNRGTELWAGVLEDDGGGAAAEGTITVTDEDPSVPNAQEAGTIALYVGGVRLAVGVQIGDTISEIGDAIEAAINAREDLPVTAENAAGTVTVTFKHKGETGNGYDLRANYNPGEKLPAGVALTFDILADGTGNPDLDTLIAAMGDRWFNVIAHPYTDATNLTALEQELVSRFGPMRSIDGVAVTSAVGTEGELQTLGETRNSPHSIIASQPGENPPTPAFEYGAEYAAIYAKYGEIDPARPFQTLAMSNALAPAVDDLFDNTERDQLLHSGIATGVVGAGGVVQVNRIITTSRKNAANADDPAYLDGTTLLTLMYLRWSFRTRFLQRYPRHKLANDGTRFGPGQAVITPKLAKAEAISLFRDWEERGLVENADQFKADLVVERSNSDPNRLEFLLPPDLINQLIVTAAQIQFRL